VLDDITAATLQVALSGLAERQRVTADNVANIETPGFCARRVMFEDTLRSAVAAGTPAQARPTLATSLEPTRLNGNNVNLDHETLSNVDTGLKYQLLLHALDSKFSLLHDAIKGGG
jgi:flagellar basal-body rod protein FlgB